MQRKLDTLTQMGPMLDTHHLQYLHNKYDAELSELMTNAERQSTKGHTMSKEYSPKVGQWLKKCMLLKWILRWHDGKVPDPRNLLRTARQQQLENPLSLTRSDIKGRLVACMQEIYRLRQQAPTLRKRHLQWCLSLAQERSDQTASEEIQEIIVNETSVDSNKGSMHR